VERWSSSAPCVWDRWPCASVACRLRSGCRCRCWCSNCDESHPHSPWPVPAPQYPRGFPTFSYALAPLAALTITYATRSPTPGAVAGSLTLIFLASSTWAILVSYASVSCVRPCRVVAVVVVVVVVVQGGSKGVAQWVWQ
jgi:hypothetical protein